MFWRDQSTAFEGIGAWASRSLNLDTGNGDPARVAGLRVSANLFPLLGVHPIAGRHFTAAEEAEGTVTVALLSYSAWQNRFGGAQDVIGRTIRLDGQPVAVIGVMPESLRFPSGATEIWVPLALEARERQSFGSHYLGAIGRLKPGVSLDAALADMQAVSRRLVEFNPGSAGWDVVLFDLHAYTVEGVRDSLMLLLGAVALVLLIACANVANLLLARGASRYKELAIRSSIGATRGRLVRQLLVEQLVLSSASALAGVLLAAWLLRILLVLVPDALPAHASVSLDRQVLAFARGTGADHAGSHRVAAGDTGLTPGSAGGVGHRRTAGQRRARSPHADPADRGGDRTGDDAAGWCRAAAAQLRQPHEPVAGVRTSWSPARRHQPAAGALSGG